MTTQITMKDLLEAGVHFGHPTSRWNPKMKPFIFGARNGIYIIDLQKTVLLAKEALTFVTQLAAQGKKVLFVGTKAQSKEVIKEQAGRVGCPFVSERWLGGILTNHTTIQTCIDKMNRIEDKKQSGMIDQMTKKEKSGLEKEYQKLVTTLGGIRHMKDTPGAMFVVDPVREHNAIREARKLKIPIIAITDTNCDPDNINFIIPGNDDALKSVKLFATAIANAYEDGSKIYEERTRAYSDKNDATENKDVIDQMVDAAEAAEAENKEPGSVTDRDGRTVAVEVKRKLNTNTEENN